MSEENLPRTHAALTGRCRSGGSADTLIREFIRVSGCLPIHVRIADSAACHSSHLISPIKSASICGASVARTCGFPLCVLCAFRVRPLLLRVPSGTLICGFILSFSWRLGGLSHPSSISVYQCSSGSPHRHCDKLTNCRSFRAAVAYFEIDIQEFLGMV